MTPRQAPTARHLSHLKLNPSRVSELTIRELRAIYVILLDGHVASARKHPPSTSVVFSL